MTSTVVTIDGSSLSCAQVAAVARQQATVAVAAAAEAAAQAAWQVAQEVAAQQPVYGRTTGVGANHVVPLSERDRAEHGFRLLRSHAAGAGPLLAPEVARAMLVIRANQIGAGGSGVDPALLAVLADAVNRGFTPPIPLYGAIGTGDLTALASTGAVPARRAGLAGRHRAAAAVRHPHQRGARLHQQQRGDAERRRARLLRPGGLAALGHRRWRACPCSRCTARWSPTPRRSTWPAPTPGSSGWRGPGARDVRGRPGVRASGCRTRSATGRSPRSMAPRWIRSSTRRGVIEAELNGSPENPLIDVAGHAVWHNGNFHTAYVGLALDAVRAALFQTAALSVARLGTLVEPAFTGLNAFLAENPASSGIMILEYVAHSAVADIRRFAAPAALGGAVLSRGVEEHAGFGTQSARATSDAVAAYRAVLGCELHGRDQGAAHAGPAAGRGWQAAPWPTTWPILRWRPDTADRPLDNDLVAAQAVLDEFATMDTALATERNGEPMSIMGTRVLRTEDPRLLTEGGVYVDDLRVPELTRAAFATFVRSPMAHALITGIDAVRGPWSSRGWSR